MTTGVARVQAFKGNDVWKQGEKGAWPMDLLEPALARSQSCNIGTVRDNVLDPLVYVVEYTDGQHEQRAARWMMPDDGAKRTVKFERALHSATAHSNNSIPF